MYKKLEHVHPCAPQLLGRGFCIDKNASRQIDSNAKQKKCCSENKNRTKISMRQFINSFSTPANLVQNIQFCSCVNVGVEAILAGQKLKQ